MISNNKSDLTSNSPVWKNMGVDEENYGSYSWVFPPQHAQKK